jgi:hypothetical protein
MSGMTHAPQLIALCSPAMGMGKSTVAEHLMRRHHFHHVKFAAPLKDMIRTMLTQHAGIARPLVERYVDGDLKEIVIPELGVTSRSLQQTLGTEWGRERVRPDLWVHLTRLKIQALLGDGCNVVVDDMRFSNELDLIRELGGEPVMIRRPDVKYQGDHASEGALNGESMHCLINDGAIEDLHNAVDLLLAHLRSDA